MASHPLRELLKRFRRRLRGPLLRGLLSVFAVVPLPIAHLMGHFFGWLFYLFSRELRAVARRNIEICLPLLDRQEREDLVRAALVENGKFFTEVGRVWLSSRARFDRMIQHVHGEEHLQAALAQRKGVFIVAPHQGSWEVLGLYLSTRHPMTSLYRPPPVSALDSLVRGARQRFGAQLVPTDASGVRRLMVALKDNQLVGILPDQDPGEQGGEFAPFFGIETNTMTLFTRLAQKTGAPALLCHAERLPQGRGFDIWLSPLPTQIHDTDTKTALTVLNRAVADLARQQPTQYLWVYRRFRTRPSGQPNLYEEV